MLGSLTVGGFKGFNLEAKFDFAPITLIYGPNSSGKSSALQALLLLKQSILPSVNSSAALQFRSPEYLDLGNFENVVYAHKKTSAISIGLELPVPTSALRNSDFRRRINKFRLISHFRQEGIGDVSVSRLDLHLNGGDKPTIILTPIISASSPDELADSDFVSEKHSRRSQGFEISSIDAEAPIFKATFDEFVSKAVPKIIANLKRSKAQYETFAKAYKLANSPFADDLKRTDQRLKYLSTYSYNDFLQQVMEKSALRYFELFHFLPTLLRIKSVGEARANASRPDVEDLPDLNRIVFDMGLLTQNTLNALTYIGPLRNYPERTYIYSGSQSDSVGPRGQNLPHMLFSREIYHEQLNKMAQMLGIDYEIRVSQSKVKELNDVFAVRLYDKKTKLNVGLNDVGFGISQVLPILLELCLSTTSTVLIEQPEIHLHPKLQAALGDVIAASREANPDRQFIIETHSEHLLLRLQKLMRLKRLPSSTVKVLFVDKLKGGSEVRNLPLAKNGDLLEHWPNGFFDEAFQDVFATAE